MAQHRSPTGITLVAIVAGVVLAPGIRITQAAPQQWESAIVSDTSRTRLADGTMVRSSSALDVAFQGIAEADHYRVVVRDQGRSARVASLTTTRQTRLRIAGLSAGSAYSIDVTACLDAKCERSVTPTSGGRAAASTDEEVWQIQASGESIASALRVVSDGNVKVHATRFGPEAPAEVAGRVQLYYGPMTQSAKGLAVAPSDEVATRDASSVSTFTSLAGRAGLVTPATGGGLVAEVATGQAVPLASGQTRLFFEARGVDGRTRIMHLDSHDGFLGRDFHAGAATVCATATDFAPGGPCAPTLDVSVSADPSGNQGFTDARQFKIGYPLLDDWRFHETPGTFMVLTVSGVSPSCSRAMRTTAYALFDGARWVVQYGAAACPKLFENIQAPMPVHVGGGRYKMYFGNPNEVNGRLSGSQLPWLGPKRVAYADAAATGDPNVVEFEDWEPLALARTVRFVWPSGRPLTETESGYLDDFVMLTPTGDSSLQVMYTGMTDGRNAPFVAMAVLLNP